jgi:hypothetical protein
LIFHKLNRLKQPSKPPTNSMATSVSKPLRNTTGASKSTNEAM